VSQRGSGATHVFSPHITAAPCQIRETSGEILAKALNRHRTFGGSNFRAMAECYTLLDLGLDVMSL